MDESIAWLQQALADRRAIERLAGNAEGWMRCHALAKCQQTMEKSLKAVVAALREAKVLHVAIGYRHEAARFLTVLIRLPHAAANRGIQHHLQSLLNQDTRNGIDALDALAPKAPLLRGRSWSRDYSSIHCTVSRVVRWSLDALSGPPTPPTPRTRRRAYAAPRAA